MKINSIGHLVKTNPIQTQSNPKQSQNKPNFRKAKMKLNFYSKRNYENVPLRRRGQNKPNSNPISKQLVGAKPRRDESAKMAQIVANRGVITVRPESIKNSVKKPNLLTIKMLSRSHRPVPKTGTPFAHLEFVR